MGEGHAERWRVVLSVQPMLNVVCKRFGASLELDDAVQECTMAVFTAMDQFDGSSRVTTWAWRVAVNHLRSMHRKKRPVLSDDFDPEEVADRDDRTEEVVQSALSAMDSTSRMVIDGRFGLTSRRRSMTQLAKEMCMSRYGVRQTWDRAAEALRRQLADSVALA